MLQINKAKKEILATMDIFEEQHSPLPFEYFSLLEKKYEEGVKIQRLIFGPKKQYKSFLTKMKEKRLFFISKHTSSTNYKRMIMIDGNKLFFQKKDKGLNKFYFSTNSYDIDRYRDYFNKL